MALNISLLPGLAIVAPVVSGNKLTIRVVKILNLVRTNISLEKVIVRKLVLKDFI